MRAPAAAAALCAACAAAFLGLAARRVRRSDNQIRTQPAQGAEERSVRPPLLTEADGETVYAHFRAGSELLESGNPAQACVRLEKARALAPDRCSIREALGRAYFAIGRLPEAEGEFRAVTTLSPTDDYAHYCLARTLRRLGRSTEARAHLSLARALRPNDPRYALTGP